jgi:hypothetical protein
MSKFFKRILVTAFVMSFIGSISASESARDPEKTRLIDCRAMIQDEFSGLETVPIVKAFVSWMEETQGDITVMPPTEVDSLFFDLAVKGEGNDISIFDKDLQADGKNPEPWSKGCRHTFYLLRITSRHPVVKALDGENREILAFTFTGCTYKFIAVVADRMRDENMLYTTMLHELGHMWGLPDNKDGKSSIMNGSWPGSKCITKKDLHDVYDKHSKHGKEPKDKGCVSK